MTLNNLPLKVLVVSILVISACGKIIKWSLQPPVTTLPRPNQLQVSTVSGFRSPQTAVREPTIFERHDAQALDIAAAPDAFEAREWAHFQPISQPLTAAPVAQPPMPASPVAPPPISAPSLPFKYMGQMEDGGQLIIYLSRGEQTVVAHAGEIIDQEYKVAAVNKSAIEFEILSSGAKLSLPIPAAQ